jgi:hypothetical protein
LSDLLSALRDPSEGAATARLAELVVADLLARPIADVIDPQRCASVLTEVLSDWLRSDRAEAKLLEAWTESISKIQGESRRLDELAPPELRQAVEELAAQHYSPDREVLLAILDRPPVREIFRDLLTETLTSFGKKLSVGSGAGGALGALGKLGGGRGGAVGGLLGRVGDVASAVGGELERQLERRIPEFVDSGLSQLLQRFVDMLSDPDRAVQQAEVRLALLEGLWERTGPELAGELARLDADAAAAVLRKSLSAWLSREEASAQVAGWIGGLLDAYGDLDLRRVLEDLDLLESFTEHSTELAQQAALRLFETDAFGDWLEGVAKG